ncbi:hypothetical protein G6F24_018194 [Rhizopus arrhizus]|nr:hypothetical protein G6F24_018194 [Rhizopus arrhizus]
MRYGVARLRRPVGLDAQPRGRPQRIHAAAVRAQACPDGHVGPRRPPWREAVRQARVHHGRCRSAAAVVPAFRARRDRLGGPAAERVA